MISTEKRPTRSALTASRLREVVSYDPATGVFRWLPRIVRPENRRGDMIFNTRFAGTIAGGLTLGGYRQFSVDSVVYLAHRLAWLYVHSEWPPGDLDHKDNCQDHNWIDNLRPASDSQNLANTLRNSSNTSGFKGVVFERRDGRWRAQIKKDGKWTLIGRFNTPELAHAAYTAKAQELFGQFANGG